MNDGQESIETLRKELLEDVHNSETWDALIQAVGTQTTGTERVTALREVYENALQVFPTSTSYFREYCEFEIQDGDDASVKALFGRCLLVCLDVDLYGLYVDYIKSVSHDDVEQIKACLEFALENVGQDCRAGGLWEEYLELLKATADESSTAKIRSAFHRALLIPSNSLDSIWSMYEVFENSAGNKELAKRSLDEWRSKYHACKAVCNERMALCDELDTKMLPLPPGKGGRYQMEQAQKWREFCRFERNHPVSDDEFSHQSRVILAYEQSLSYFVQFPDIWLDYAEWRAGERNENVEAAINVLNKGREALPTALALHFMAADFHEQEGNVDAAREIYEELVADKNDQNKGDDQEDSSEETKLKTLAWIVYMRFTKRVDGVQKSRLLFMRARKFAGLRWEAYAAAARFEWLNDGNKEVACKIYELGLKSFLGSPGYVLEYAKFLIGVGDLGNARSLFERALTETSDDETAPLWAAFIAMEAECGGFSTVASLQARRKEMLKEVAMEDPLDAMSTALLRYKFLDLYPGLADQFEVAPDLFEDLDEAEVDVAVSHPGTGSRDPLGHGQPAALYSSTAPTDMSGPGGRPPRRPMVPRELHGLAMLLQRGEVDGPIPDVEYVLGPVLSFDFSAQGVARHEEALGIANGGGMRGPGGPGRKRGRRH